MVEVRYRSRLGNNLFQYCLGRILAEALGFALEAKPIEGFPNTSATIAGARYDEPEQVLTGQHIDIAGILNDRSPRRIVLDGHFQQIEYYRPHRASIREWLAFDRSALPAANPRVCVHVRRTDYIRHGWALPFSYYSEALEMVAPDGEEIWITTDDPKDPFFERFAAWRPRFHRGSALEQMAFLSKTARLVISQSTFAWWPAFLGEAKMVICPDPSFGVWADGGEFPGPKLLDHDRFTCIRCTETYRPTLPEAWHQQRRKLRRRAILRLNSLFRQSIPVPWD